MSYDLRGRKVLGMPIALVIVLSIVLVSATVFYLSYNHEFIKTINVFNTGKGDSTLQIQGLGDISSTTIDCDNTQGECTVQSGDITLFNPTGETKVCNIQTSGENVTIEYTGGIVNGDNNISIGATTFKIVYKSNTEGKHEVKTVIHCPDD